MTSWPSRSLWALFLFVFLWKSCHSQCLTPNDTSRTQQQLDRTMEQLLNGTHTFAFDLLRLLHDNSGNNNSSGIFFSPHSVWSALAVTYMGAQGLTEQELGSVLGLYGADKVAVLSAFEKIQQSLVHPNDGSNDTSEFVNRLFFHKDLEVRKCIEGIFARNMAYVDFTNPEAARLGINEWVKTQTHEKISELLPPSSVKSFTKMVIANAVYFKKDWMHQFSPKMTRPDRFTVSLTEELIVDMMRMKGNFIYGVSEALQCTALDLPYAGGDLSMTILLHQNRVFDMNSFVLQLTHERIEELIDSMFPIEVMVSLPKFRLEDSFELASNLNSMGLRQIFDSGMADLSGFTGQRELSVDAILHQAKIDVNEQGTEAAAATAILASRTARPAQPTAFLVNRPFVFFIRDRKTNLIYFLGTVMRPSHTTNKKPVQ